jgi:6-pyruvoyltetrahydropterin/6-carboxytetrahydropterin synthase
MIELTKIFHFEAAHAIQGYNGACRHIHGHSYELQVTVTPIHNNEDFIPAPGFIMDFKEIKKLVQQQIIDNLDHKLILSESFLEKFPALTQQENLARCTFEPTAENMLLYIHNSLVKVLPRQVKLLRLKIWETNNSYAEWTDGNNSR